MLCRILLVILFSCSLWLHAQERYARVRMYAEPKTLSALGLAIDHGEHRKGHSFTTDISYSEIELLKQHNIPHELLIPDVIAHYQEQNHASHTHKTHNASCLPTGGYNPADTVKTPTGFTLGSMGGFFTYSQFISHLNNLKSSYPTLVSKIDTIGYSIENRPILAFKISDNPNTNEPEPQVLYTAIHHAREPAGLSNLIFYAYYLVENYATNPEIQYLVNNRELYFIPMINPDGYMHNQITNPSGGGMWRKNRRNNGGSFGVDLNRNYGFHWGYDDMGSSPNPNNDTYRGTAAFSEPELQAVRNFCQAKNFKIALNYHTYGNLLIYPWGHIPSYFTPDSAQFVEYGKLMTQVNNYTYGTGDQTVGYVVNGDSDDWMYGEQTTKNKILSLTPECGTSSDGFWPAMSRIIPICKENIVQNLYAARLAGQHAESKDKSQKNITALSFYLPFTTTSYGIQNSNMVTVSLLPLTTNIQTITPSSKTFGSFTSFFHTQKDSFLVQLQPSITTGSIIKFILQTSFNGITYRDTLTKIYNPSSGTLLVNDNATNLSQWTTTTGWNITTSKFVSAPSSITDTPTGMYANNANTMITSLNSISLASAVQAKVNFYAQWDIENDYDYVQFMVSTNGGSTWIPQCGIYTNNGTGTGFGGVQPLNEPLYDGTQNTWIQEEISLSDYLGMSNVKFRFRLGSDAWVTKDGFYFDDFKVEVTLASGITQTIFLNEKDFILYPNPAQDKVNILLPTHTQYIHIIDNLGRTVQKETLNLTDSYSLNTQNLTEGIYTVVIYTEKQVFTQKLSIIR
jgi:hypothetical protein